MEEEYDTNEIQYKLLNCNNMSIMLFLYLIFRLLKFLCNLIISIY